VSVHLRRLGGWVCGIVEIFFGFVTLEDFWSLEDGMLCRAERGEACSM
jgi:hypothetical protein